MATWSEEEGSGSCTGQSIWRGGGWAEWCRPSKTDHLLSPLRSCSPVAIFKQLHYEADQIKKRKKTWHTTICRNTTSVFEQSVRCGSQCWYSQQGWSQQDELETTGLHNEASCPVGKSKRATFTTVVNFILCYIVLAWHWAAKRPVSICKFTHHRQSSN